MLRSNSKSLSNRVYESSQPGNNVSVRNVARPHGLQRHLRAALWALTFARRCHVLGVVNSSFARSSGTERTNADCINDAGGDRGFRRRFYA